MSDSFPDYRPPLPRLIFSGRYLCDVSTVNNDIRHYDVDDFRPNYQMRQDEKNMNGWNPEGTGTFSFVNCKVTAVQYPEDIQGNAENGHTPRQDALIGCQIAGNKATVQGKMVDLDPQIQIISQIFGVEVHVTLPPEQTSNPGDPFRGFAGVIRPCAFRDMWRSLPSASGFAGLSAVYQGIISLTEFSDTGSEFLQCCQPFIESTIESPDFPRGALSIRFVLSNYDSDHTSDSFRYGDISGYIQPWLPDYPETFDAGRVMRPLTKADDPYPQTGPVYFHLQRNAQGQVSIFVDLCNSLSRKGPHEYEDIGKLSLYVFKNGYEGSFENSKCLLEIPYNETAFYNGSSVFEERVMEEAHECITSKPLGLVSGSLPNREVIFVEENRGYYCKADQTFMRLNYDEWKVCRIFVTRFGTRVQNHDIKIAINNSCMVQPGAPRAGEPIDGIIVNNGVFDNKQSVITVTTNQNGFAEFEIKGGNTNNNRGILDGQVYGLKYSATWRLPSSDPRIEPSDKINIRVFDPFTAPENPSWIGHILPIFKQYANLYPSMARIVQLDNYGSVLARRKALIQSFSAPIESGRYMPVTRDLSQGKRDMIVSWLSCEEHYTRFMNTNSVEDLFKALQLAIELEHATIPPYLATLYSIKRGYNQYIADAIQSVAIDEMKHMTMVCNILIAIGGKPNINKIGFVPKYPGPLPGGLRQGLMLRLRKLSLEQIKAFMDLESPEKQALEDGSFVTGDLASHRVPLQVHGTKSMTTTRSQIQSNEFTIGFMYDEIAKALQNQSALFSWSESSRSAEEQDKYRNQVTGHFGLDPICKVEHALRAIVEIKLEGEGASPSNPTNLEEDSDTGLKELSHYFRFSEIANGRRIVIHEGINGGFSYTGPKIEIDEDGVYNMQDDPNLKFLPSNSKERLRQEAFARRYKALLNALHISFNGRPSYIDSAISTMFQLTIFAEPLMEMPALNLDGSTKSDGTTVGVSFQMPFDEEEEDA